MPSSTGSSHSGEVNVTEKATEAHVQPVHTNEKVPGQSHYYEKDGLRTYGDNEDHDHEPKVHTLAPPTSPTSHWTCP